MSDRLKLPPTRDFGFYQRRKHDKWREVEPPALEAPVADSHAHIHMLPDPAWEIARCAANGVDFICEICDPSEDGTRPFDELETWVSNARNAFFGHFEIENDDFACFANDADANERHSRGGIRGQSNDLPPKTQHEAKKIMHDRHFRFRDLQKERFDIRVAAGVHPHNAKHYDRAIEEELLRLLHDQRVVALGEIGLDYHYDLSPRNVQRLVFRRQIEIAEELGLPIALHLRGGDDPKADNAHAEAFAILREMGMLGPGTLLHCCALPPDELQPWIDADCYIAYGGALTFKASDAAREGAKLVPENRLLLETDAPYMAPEPMRGAACTPAHVVFTAAALAETRGIAQGAQRGDFLRQVHANTLAFYRV